jgi:hypothetical protein
VLARCPDGGWIFASTNRYEPRRPDETGPEAERRLRDCVARTKDKGTIVEFVQARDTTARTETVSLESVRQRLRDHVREGVPLDFHGALCTPQGLPERHERTQVAPQGQKDRLTRDQGIARNGDGPAAPRVLVITA